jgi:hypothetical protein
MKSKVPEQDKPRYEFRSFGQDFQKAHYRMSRLSQPVPEELWNRTFNDIYIFSSTNNINNIKIREGQIEIKTLIHTLDELEQWDPLMDEEFPLSSKLYKRIFQALNVKSPVVEKNTYSFDEFIQVIKTNPYLNTVRVKKERQSYLVNDTICEFTQVWVNGAKISTISTESTDVENIRKTISQIGLEGIENINYLQALKRITGMVDKPLAN